MEKGNRNALIIQTLAGIIATGVGVFFFTPVKDWFFKKPEIDTVKPKNNIDAVIRYMDTVHPSDKFNNVKIEENPTQQNLSTPKESSSILVKNSMEFLNSGIKNSASATDICVTIIDDNSKVLYSLSNLIADLYHKIDVIGNTGLLKSSFIVKQEFSELFEGDSKIIENLNLMNYTDYLALGKVQYAFRDGTLVNSTHVCTITMEMNIISAINKGIHKSFTISEIGNGATEAQAKEKATQKLIERYNNDYLKL